MVPKWFENYYLNVDMNPAFTHWSIDRIGRFDGEFERHRITCKSEEAETRQSYADEGERVLPDDGDAEDDDEEAGDRVADFGHLLSSAESFGDQAENDGAGEADDQVDHCGYRWFA